MFYCQSSPVEWIMSILRSLAGHLAGLLAQLGLNIASLAMNRLLYSIFTFSRFPTLSLPPNKKGSKAFLCQSWSLRRRPLNHFVAATRKSGLGLGRKIGTRHRWSWNPPKLRWIPRSSHFSSSQSTIQTGSRPDSPVQLWTRHSFRKIMNWSFRHNCNIKRSHHLRTMIAQGRQWRKIKKKHQAIKKRKMENNV